MHSYTKRSEEDSALALEEHQTGYCPLDLYSGETERVTRAVEALWNAWIRTEGSANNLRFSYEGVRVEPSDVSARLRDPASRRSPLLDRPLRSTHFYHHTSITIGPIQLVPQSCLPQPLSTA